MTEVTHVPETDTRMHVLNVMNVEFEEDGITVRDDKIHDSLGWDGDGPLAGVYPARAGESLKDGQVLETTVMVQFFGKWDREINPNETVSPAAIEAYAERFRRALRIANLGSEEFPGTGQGGSAHLWYYRVVSIEYPDDPSGNKTRFLATVLAFAQNPAIVETSG